MLQTWNSPDEKCLWLPLKRSSTKSIAADVQHLTRRPSTLPPRSRGAGGGTPPPATRSTLQKTRTAAGRDTIGSGGRCSRSPARSWWHWTLEAAGRSAPGKAARWGNSWERRSLGARKYAMTVLGNTAAGCCGSKWSIWVLERRNKVILLLLWKIERQY